MLRIVYTPSFVRTFDDLPSALQEETREKIALFQENPRHPSLKAHKLKGKLRKYWSFSVNYKYRILYEYDAKSTVALLTVGSHDIYN